MKNRSGYTIRGAIAEDIPFLAGIEQAAASLFPVGSIPDHIRTDAMPVDMLQASLRAGHLWVAVDADNTRVGFAVLQSMDGLALLAEIDVLPEHGRKGIGRSLIDAVARRAWAEHYRALYLTTFAHIAWNAPFYEGLGFVAVPAAELPTVILQILAEERERGLTQRIAMRLAVTDEAHGAPR